MKTIVTFLCLVGLAGSALAAEKKVLTLKECYQKALLQSESLAIQTENLNIAEAHYQQALAEALPHISGNASELIQDTPPSGGGAT